MCWKNENETQIHSPICFVISLVILPRCHNQAQFSIYPGPIASWVV